MPYGTIKVDTVTFTNDGVDKSVSISGLVQNPTFSGNVTVTGTISGVTVTGTTANFTSGNFTNISGGTHTITSGVFAAGSAASPSITFTGDLNTGIYSPGADQVAISTGGSGRLFVKSDGSIAVGAPTGDAVLEIGFGATANRAAYIDLTGDTTYIDYGLRVFRDSSGANAASQLLHRGTGDFALNTVEAAPFIVRTNNTERLRITSAGLVGVGTSSPSATTKMSIVDSTSAGIYFLRTAQGETVIENTGPLTIRQSSGNGANQNIFFKTGTSVGTEVTAMTIDGSQRVGIGTTSPSTTTRMSIVDSASAGIYLFRTGQGETVIENTGPLTIRQSSGNGANQNIFFKTGASVGTEVTAMTIDGSQRVGIGTTSPGGKLVVSDGSTTFQFDPVGGTGNILRSLTSAGARDALLLDASQLVYSNGGTERLRCDSSGRLLVGTSSARTNIASSAAPVLQVEGTSQNASSLSLTRSDASTSSNAPFIFLTSTGGTTVGSNALVVNNTLDTYFGAISFCGTDGTKPVVAAQIDARLDGTPGANDMPGRLVFSTTEDGASSPTERARLDSSGNLLLGTTAAGGRLTVHRAGGAPVIQASQTSSGDYVYASSASNNGGTYYHFNFVAAGVGGVGNISSSSTTTSYNTTSDYRLKENVTAVTNGIVRLQQLKPSRFNFIADPTKTVDGFIAHEVQQTVPEAVTGEKDAVDDNGNPIYQGIDQSKLVPLLTAALQEAIAKIESLEARLDAANL